jgi:hypothetical protein
MPYSDSTVLKPFGTLATCTSHDNLSSVESTAMPSFSQRWHTRFSIQCSRGMANRPSRPENYRIPVLKCRPGSGHSKGTISKIKRATRFRSEWKRASTGGLLRLLRMKSDLLSLHLLYQFLDPIKQRLVSDSGRHALIILDLLVDLNALLTHGPPFQAGDANRGHLWDTLQIRRHLVPCSAANSN